MGGTCRLDRMATTTTKKQPTNPKATVNPVTVMRNDGPVSGQVQPPKTGGKREVREVVTLPTAVIGKAIDDGTAFPNMKGGPGKTAEPNVMLAKATEANEDRKNDVKSVFTYPDLTEQQANKVKNLLSKAGKELGCSFRTYYNPETKALTFQAIEKITRTRKGATAEVTAAA